MRGTLAFIALLSAAGLIGGRQPAKAEDGGPEQLAAAFRLVEDAVAKGEIPGAAALVARQGKIVREEAYGYCDLKENRPFTTSTICWIASITKPVTAAAAMKLVEQGKLGLDDPVEKYLPDFKDQTDRLGRHHVVTIRHLMSHTSGIQANPPTRPSFFFEQGFLSREIGEIATAIAGTHLEFEPGSQVKYSNAAPYVLGRIVELASGKRFGEHVKESILEPAGMHDTYFIIPPLEAGRVAVVYRETDGGRVEFFRFDPTWKVTMTLPDGGLFSSPRQIMKFLRLFLEDDGSVLSKVSVKAMLTEQAPGWGLGWALEGDGSFSHTGSSGTLAWADPKTGVIGVLFCQLQNPAKTTPLQNRFRQAVRTAYGP